MSDEIFINVNEDSNDIIVQIAELDILNNLDLNYATDLQLFQTGANLQSEINTLNKNVVFITGNQTISGIKSFKGGEIRFGRNFDGTNKITLRAVDNQASSESLMIIDEDNDDGGETLSALFIASFDNDAIVTNRPLFSNIRPVSYDGTNYLPVLLSGEAYPSNNPSRFIASTGNETISGVKTFVNTTQIDSVDFIRNFRATGTTYNFTSNQFFDFGGSTGVLCTGWNLAPVNPSDDSRSIRLSSGSYIVLNFIQGIGSHGFRWFAVSNSGDLSKRQHFKLFSGDSPFLSVSLPADSSYSLSGFLPREYDRFIIERAGGGGALPSVNVSGNFGVNNEIRLEARDNRLFLGKSGVLFQDESSALSTANYITVQVTNNSRTNGANLLAAYAKAKTTLPNGSALSATNRLAIILPPAIYDLGTESLILDTQYIDIIGSTPDRSKHHIKSDVGITNSGTVKQTANNVKLYNLTIENVHNIFLKTNSSSDPAAYFPNSNLNNTYLENINLIGSVNIWSMRVSIHYSGTFKDCTGGDYAFGGGGNASGTFENCTGGDFAFGGGGNANGTFENCTGGDYTFGAFATASGTFENCTGGAYAFGGSGDASGAFENCTGGYSSFGFNASGTFENCTGGDYAFAVLGTASGTFKNCTGGDYTFGTFGTASGTFENCTGGNYAFGGDQGNASGTFKDCKGGNFAFGGNGGNASGTFENCTGGYDSFNL